MRAGRVVDAAGCGGLRRPGLVTVVVVLGFAGAFVVALGFAGAFVAALGFAGAFVAALGFAGAFVVVLGFAGAFVAALGFAGDFVAGTEGLCADQRGRPPPGPLTRGSGRPLGECSSSRCHQRPLPVPRLRRTAWLAVPATPLTASPMTAAAGMAGPTLRAKSSNAPLDV